MSISNRPLRPSAYSVSARRHQSFHYPILPLHDPHHHHAGPGPHEIVVQGLNLCQSPAEWYDTSKSNCLISHTRITRRRVRDYTKDYSNNNGRTLRRTASESQLTVTRRAHPRQQLEVVADRVSELSLDMMSCGTLQSNCKGTSRSRSRSSITSVLAACSPRPPACSPRINHPCYLPVSSMGADSAARTSSHLSNNYLLYYDHAVAPQAEDEWGFEVDHDTVRLHYTYDLERV